MLDALSFMQSKHYLHRDIKPDNILVIKDEENIKFKLCDFGFATL